MGNDWAGFAAVMPTAIWGGYPGKHSPEDIQSGQGWVGNYRMYDNVQKAVVRSPFINPVHPKGPATLDDAAVGGRMAHFTVKPSFRRLVPLLLTLWVVETQSQSRKLFLWLSSLSLLHVAGVER